MTRDVLADADHNMREAWRALTSVAPTPGVLERDDVLMLSSGIPIALFNPAFVIGTPSDAEALVAEVIDHYASVGAPFVLYFRDETAPGLGDVAGARLVEHFTPPLMVLDPIAAVPAPPAGVDIVTVDAGSIDAYREVLAVGFGMPAELVAAAFTPAALEADGFTYLLATAGGVPIATSASFVSDDVAGVYNVATAPDHRGRGLGAAITWAAVDAGSRAGCSVSILQSSEAGAPVYERMGFVTRDRYRQLEPRS